MSCARGCCPDSKTHYKSLRIGTDRNRPFKNGWTLNSERQEARDIDAYKRMRAQGLQPADYSGCEQLEKHAVSDVEITHGKVMPKELVQAFDTVKSEGL
jgi:hypothetical protein